MTGPSAVMVTGGAGYIGSQVTFKLLEAGHRVCVLDDLSTGSASNVPQRAQLVVGDVGNRGLVREVLRTFEPDAVIHMAARTSAPDSVGSPLTFYETNTEKTRRLVEELANCPSRPSMVFASTAAVYAKADSKPITETYGTDPPNPYGASKLMAERMITDAGTAHGLRYAILRFFNVVGTGAAARGGKVAAEGSVLEVISDVLAGRLEFMQVNGLDHPTYDGSPVRDFIHVDDVAEAHLAVLALMNIEGSPRLFNCGVGRGYSVLELIAGAEALTGRSIQRVVGARRPGDPSQVVADAGLLRSCTGWKPQHTSLTDLLSGVF